MRLSERDFRAILELVEKLYACPTADAYAVGVVHGLPEIIPSDIWAVNDANRETGRIGWVANADRDIPDSREIFARHMHEHPFIIYRSSTYGTHAAARLSDLVGAHEWRGSNLYNEFYRPFAIEHMLAVPLAVSYPRELQVIASRDDRDFDERDRLALRLLGPHFSAAIAHAETISGLEADLAALQRGLEADGRAVVLLGPGRRIRQISERAQDWLRSYFGAGRSDRAALPPLLDAWLRRQQPGAVKDGELGEPRRPLVVERDGKRLTVRALSAHGRTFLLLSERKLRIEREDLASLGLSPRESEVLAWLAGGKTNGAIAEILGLSPITIKHCVERIYAKLDVRTRAAATARALGAAGSRD